MTSSITGSITSSTTGSIPRIISVDDHVVEPPDLWTSRLPREHIERGPRVVREKFDGGGANLASAYGGWADVWYYDDVRAPMMVLMAAVGFEDSRRDFGVTTYDDIRPGGWKQTERLSDMDDNHVDASLCFPNTIPRFCGQTFAERADKELALECVKAYNDWMIDEWCAGDGHGRLVPVTMVPLWDVELAAAEVRRSADKGSHALTFSENPYALGLPSVHSGEWDPLFAACEETETVLCMHIGSSSKMPGTTPDAPFIVSSVLTFANAMGSLLDFVFSGTLARFPNLTIAYSEGQVGWMPYVLERMDKLWLERSDNAFGSSLTEPPTTYIKDRVIGCIFDDESGLEARNRIGMDTICFEVDYPHADSTFPHSKKVATDICTQAGLNEDEIYKLLRGNAIRAFGLERFGITK
jgi:predicted TIM-barrel fold metal-dependent hydrolase